MPPPINRRRLLFGSASLALGTAIGCSKDPGSADQPAKVERQDVPLRIALVGSEQDAETIRRGWGAVSELPLEFQTIPPDRTQATRLSDLVTAAADRSDLLIYPLSWVPELATAQQITPLSSEEIDQIDEESGDLLAALRSGAAKYAGRFMSIPLGAPLPALLSAGEANVEAASVDSWLAYDQRVDQQWGGSAAEPTAPGWCGAMFLWRCAADQSWLLDREDLHPLIDTEPYVRSLELMVKTCGRYQRKQQSPGQIWSAVKSGELKGGIGFPLVRAQSDDVDFQIGNLPGTSQLTKVLLDPFSTVISLSVRCRQSAAAKRFIQWISGGEGSEGVRGQVAGMTEVRTQETASANLSSYDRWLNERLSTPVTAPTLQLLEAGSYYDALDAQVGRAIGGEATPEAALAEVASTWLAITRQVGVDKQRRTWRRAQGMGI